MYRIILSLIIILLVTPSLSAQVPEGYVATESGCIPDGGLCLVPAEAQATDTISARLTRTWIRDLQPEIVYGSATVTVATPEGEVLLTVSDSLLSGHAYFERRGVTPYVDYERGIFRDPHSRLRQLCRAATGDLNDCYVRITYRYAATDERLEEAQWHAAGSPPQLDTLDVSWWGMVPDAERDYQPLLAHILNVARLRQAPVVLFPECGVYGYYGSLVLASDVTIKGQGGTEVVEETDDLGHTFYPVRETGCTTRLRALEHTAVQFVIQDELGASEPGTMAPDEIDPAYQIKKDLHAVQTVIYAGSGVMEVGLEDLVLDGNLAGQHDDYMVLDRRPNWPLKEVFRNAPSNAGLVTTNHGGVEVPVSQHLSLERVVIMGYSEGTLGHAGATWTLRDVRISDAPLNHLVYCTTGAWENVTLAGLAWHVGPAACAKAEGLSDTTYVENLVVEESRENPYRQPDDGGIGARGGTLLINGFYMDLRGGAITRPLGGEFDLLHAQNGVILLDRRSGGVLMTGNEGARLGSVYENVNVYLGADSGYLIGRGYKKRIALRNVRVRALPGTSPSLGSVTTASVDSTSPGPIVVADQVEIDVDLIHGFSRSHNDPTAETYPRVCGETKGHGVPLPEATCAALREYLFAYDAAPEPPVGDGDPGPRYVWERACRDTETGQYVEAGLCPQAGQVEPNRRRR